jgi:hypothetical protein
MLTSGLREGSENTIRVTTAYPKSLRKLLTSFYEHVIEITSVEELIEMLFLADEYDMPEVMPALLSVLDSSTSAMPLEFTLENARLFLSCSAKLNLKLEPKIFAGLVKCWWKFGPDRVIVKDDQWFEDHLKNCHILQDSLNYIDD